MQQSVAAFNQAIKGETHCEWFTILALDHRAHTATRIYSSAPEQFPVEGIKPLLNAPWAQYLITQKVPLLSDDEAAIIKNFSDHQKITAFGIRRILNIPVLRTATCIGTVNCLYTTTTTTTTTTSTPPTADEHLMNAVARHLAQTGIL
jgi:hypothetical protein